MRADAVADRAQSESLRSKNARRPSQIFRTQVTRPARTAKLADFVLIGCFLIGINLPLLGLLFSLDRGFVLEENRTQASWPRFKANRKDLAEFPARSEAYFNDHFGFRKRLIYWLNVTKVAALGVSPSSKVILGNNRWLFYGDEDIPYFRGVQPLTPAELDGWQKRLEERQAWLADRGIPYLLVFTPVKSTVYPEYMPRAYNRIGTLSRLDQLMAHLKAHSGLKVIDLRTAILDEKSRNQVFYRTDTHWNNRGTYVGYTEIIKTLSRWFPELEVIPISAFEEFHTYFQAGRDLPTLLGMPEDFWDRYVDMKLTRPGLAHEIKPPPPASKLAAGGPDIVFEHPEAGLPRAVMFRDSYAIALIPLLSENFSRIRYTWQYTFDREIVERENPDVVIQEMVERVLTAPTVPSP